MKKILGMVLLCGICLFGCQNEVDREADRIINEYEDLGYTITYEVKENLIEKSNRMSVHLSIYVQIDEGTTYEKQILKDLMTDLSEHIYEEYGERYENQHYSGYYVSANIYLNGSDEPFLLSQTEGDSTFIF